MLKKPKILVVGSFMMDLIASTSRAPKEGETVVGMSSRPPPAVRVPTRPYSAPVWGQT